MTLDLEHLRSRNPIEEVVAEKFALKKSGSRFIGVEHDSLVVVPNTGFYFWNSRGEHGDVFDFVGRHLLSRGAWNNRDAAQFMEVVRYLAQRAGITLEENINFKQSSAWGERHLVQRLHETLLNTLTALTYVTEKRGWQLSTIKAARLGFMPQDKRPLLADLNLSDNWRTVIQKFPTNMIVYIHTEQGRLTYLSGRSIEGKKHYNPPREIIGERQPYYNHLYCSRAEQVVIVEGQADALTFAEWSIPAVAIGGMQAADELLTRLKAHLRHPFGETSPGLSVKRLYLAEHPDGILRADWTLPAEERFYPLVQLIGWKPKRDVPFKLPVKYQHYGDNRIVSLLPSGTWVLPYDDAQYQLYERAWTTINTLLQRVETAPTDPRTLRLLTRWTA